jgi:hypothetical protein
VLIQEHNFSFLSTNVDAKSVNPMRKLTADRLIVRILSHMKMQITQARSEIKNEISLLQENTVQIRHTVLPIV